VLAVMLAVMLGSGLCGHPACRCRLSLTTRVTALRIGRD
jgi:hypothetical protein